MREIHPIQITARKTQFLKQRALVFEKIHRAEKSKAKKENRFLRTIDQKKVNIIFLK